ncbi:hypothetical protein BH23ACT6_BH23ACT6_05070 [soil metagenome]
MLAGKGTVGWTLYLYSCGSMVAAAVLRLRGGSAFTRPAVIQASMPVLTLIFAKPSLLGRAQLATPSPEFVLQRRIRGCQWHQVAGGGGLA